MFVTEIFKSIQGEGTRAGLPCIFVRLTGCNLRCTWCDTAYAFHGGKKMSVDETVTRVDELAGRNHGADSSKATVPLVELTGGEPLLQEEIYRSEEHTSELQSLTKLVCRLLLEKKKSAIMNSPL